MSYLNEQGLLTLFEGLNNSKNIKINTTEKLDKKMETLIAKADDVTKAVDQELVNDGYSFKVGTGDVDVSADVEDGFGEIGIKGVTYQNLCNSTEKADISNRPYLSKSINSNLLKSNTTYTLFMFGNTFLSKVSPNRFIYREKGFIDTVFTFNTVCKFTTKDMLNFDKLYYAPVEIVNGSVTETELNNVSFIILQGDHTNNPNLPSYFEGIVGVGDKSKNLFNVELEVGGLNHNNGTEVSNPKMFRTKNFIDLEKIDGSYIKIKNAPNGMNLLTMVLFDSENNYIGWKNYTNNSIVDSKNQSGNLIGKFGRFFTLTDLPNIVDLEGVGCGFFINNNETYEEYWDGHKIEILSTGKNLFDKNYVPIKNRKVELKENRECIKVAGVSVTKFDVIKNFCPKTRYSFQFAAKNYSYAHIGQIVVHYTDGTLKVSPRNHFNDWKLNKFVTPDNGKSIEYISFDTGNLSTDSWIELNSIMIGIYDGDDHIQTHTPYASDKTQILLDEPLMKLPNGVCDEITADGKLIRRIGKVVLDGSESWNTYLEDNDLISFIGLRIDNCINKQYNEDGLICDKFIPSGYGAWSRESNVTLNTRSISICLAKSKLSTSDVAGFKQWLSQNPTTIYYELETPVITDIAPPSLRIFKNGHLTFNTLVAPTSTHLVQLNKSAQIERSVREVQSLNGRVGKLESFYDGLILETSHKLSNLDFDFSLMKKGEV